MTAMQKICRFVSVLAAMLACAWLFGSFSMLDQNETGQPVGFAMIWCARLAAFGFAIAAGLAAVAPRACMRALWVSTAGAAPLVAFFLFPPLWCFFLLCGPSFDDVVWDPLALMPVIAISVALGGMHLSKPS